MSTLSQGPRINARTTPRIHRGIKHVAVTASVHGLQFQGRDLSSEAIVSAIMTEFLELSEQEQVEFLRPALKKLEAELSA
ncbi:MAG: hypothetical protein RJA81_939 [Planctomycetota bacterium]